MKKILTASLVAMMAVTAARADIASTTYVDTKATAAQTAAETTASTALASAKSELETKITAEETRATGVESGFATRIQALEAATGDGEGSVLADAKAYTDEVAGTTKTAYESYADQAEADAIAAAAEAAKIYIDDAELAASQTAQDTTLKAYADDAAGAVSTALGEYKTLNDAAVKKVGDDLAAETLRATGVEGGFATRIEALEAATGDGEGSVLADAKAYADEKVGAEATARGEAIDAASAATKAAYEAADATLKSAYEAADATLTQGVADNAAAIAAEVTAREAADALKADKTALEAEAGAREAADTAINTTIGTLPEGQTSVVGYIASVSGGSTEAVEGVASDLADYVASNDAALAGVKATAEGAQVKSEADLAIGTATGGWTTLKALPEYCLTGSCALSSVDGAVQWVKIQ